MMNYEIFKEVVKEKFMDYMPEKFKGMKLVVEPVEKVNVTLDGIILREEGRNISPTIYINDMYKKYQDCGDLEETLMAACDFMERAYEQTPVVDVDSIMRDANEKIVFQLINTEQNKTFLEQVPHREFQDLSIVYKVIISADKDAVQSSKITNECVFDCKYCINRASNDVVRTSFTPEEVCRLTMEFYRRKTIVINGGLLRDAVISAAHSISNKKKSVDELNVFPVPDGDTGNGRI